MSHLLSSIIFVLVLLTSLTYGYLNIEQYCKAFDDSFRPMICILKNTQNATTTYPEHNNNYPQESVAILIPDQLKAKLKAKLKPKPRPRPRPRPRPHPRPIFGHPRPIYIPSKPDYSDEWEDDEEEADCSCDLNCFPVISNQNPNVTGVSYRCRSCGSSCWVKSVIQTNCSCAVPSGNATCNCVANCASWRSGLGIDLRNTDPGIEEKEPDTNDEIKKASRMGWGWSPSTDYDESNSDSGEDINCIFTISNLTDTRIAVEQRPFNCACCKSTEAERTSDPDFVCICQRVTSLNRKDLIQLSNDPDTEYARIE